MDNLYSSQPLTERDADRMREHLERAQREETEWLEARLHHALHGNWLGRDECATCLYEAEGKTVVFLSDAAVKAIGEIR